eukprot:scaffold141_cov410-Prasinococcus_capsulatus_cf.AAC.4
MAPSDVLESTAHEAARRHLCVAGVPHKAPPPARDTLMLLGTASPTETVILWVPILSERLLGMCLGGRLASTPMLSVGAEYEEAVYRNAPRFRPWPWLHAIV